MPQWVEKVLEFLKPRAKAHLDDEHKREILFTTASRKLLKVRKGGPITDLVEDVKWLIHMLRSFFKGIYKEIPIETIVIIITAIIYFVMPIDLLPDLLPGGIIDDTVILGFVIKNLRKDIEIYRLWWKEYDLNKSDKST